jgi:Protein of unknown function (DUF3145)
MRDYTSFQAYVYACPEKQRAAAHRVLTQEYRLTLEAEVTAPGQLSLTKAYTARDFCCGCAPDVAGALRDAAPGASFVLWEDPAETWLGDLYAYTPALGEFNAECDCGGNPAWTPEAVKQAITQIMAATPSPSAETLLAELDSHMGVPWLADWQAHRPGLERRDA